MKRISNKVSTVLASCIGSVLAFFTSSCDSIIPNTREEYGTPRAEYSIKTKVIGEGQALEGIEISVQETVEVDGKGTIQTIKQGVTNAQGEVELTWDSFPQERRTFTVLATDIDGEKNGNWAPASTVITLLSKNAVGGKGWYNGKISKEVALKLSLKKPN